MGLISWALAGLVLGGIPALLWFQHKPSLILGALVAGLAGAIGGGLYSIQLGWHWGDITSFNIRSCGVASLSALVVVGIYALPVYQSIRKRADTQNPLG